MITPPSSFGVGIRKPFTPDLAQDNGPSGPRLSASTTGRYDVWEADVQLAAGASWSATVETLCLAFGWERSWVVTFLSGLTLPGLVHRSNNVLVERVA